MKPRLEAYKVAPAAMQTMAAVETYLKGCGLEASLLDLVKTRASQINGCAFCLHMHTKDARSRGETEERLYLLNAWRESALYTPRERAALAWTDALTLISETHAPDEAFEQVRREFNDEELVNLTLAIGAINAWNRIAIGFRQVHPAEKRAARE
jgi:AhpD family alkylhydroperoxidase